MKNELYRKTEQRLYEHPFLLKRIKMLKIRIEELKPGDISTRSLYMSSQTYSKYNDFIAAEKPNVEDFRELLKKELKEKETLCAEVDAGLDCLNEIEKKIIVMRYFKLKRMLEISDTLGYSREYGSRVRKKAVSKIGMVLWGVTNEEMSMIIE